MKTAICPPMEISLRLIGVWPNSSYRILKRILWTSITLVFLTCQYWYCLSRIGTVDLKDFVDLLSIALSNTLVIIKIIIMWLKNRVFNETFTMINEDWNDHETNMNKNMIRRAAISYRITKCLMMIFSSSVIVYDLTTFFTRERNSTEKIFFVYMVYPFDPTVSPIYEIICFVHIFGEWLLAVISGILVSLIATIVLHITGQIDLVTDRLIEALSTKNEKQSRMMSLKDAITKHQRVISMSEKIESGFTFIAFTQFFFDIIVLCFISFTLVTSLDTDEVLVVAFKSLPYYAAVNFQALILCYSGEYLTTKSENIGWVIYNSNWYELSIIEIRTLLFFILRTQKPLKLTIGKFTDLSLVTFANIVKACMSYMSVLYAME